MLFLALGVIRRERVRSQVMNVDGHPAYAPAIAEKNVGQSRTAVSDIQTTSLQDHRFINI
jgi:hypothetical protein